MKTQSWIENNKSLFEGIEAGEIYVIFRNEPPIKMQDAGDPKYKSVYYYKGDTVKGTSVRISKKGNKFITKAAKCEYCGSIKAAKKLKSSLCETCLYEARIAKMRGRYFNNKKPKVIEKPKKEKVHVDPCVYDGLNPGILYCVFKGNEVLKLNEVKHLFKPGRKKLSPVTKAEYVGRICICKGKNCGKKRFSRSRIGSLCKKCQDSRNTKASEEKKKSKTVEQIALEITGPYERVVRRPYVPEIFDEVERGMRL